jgi:L-xylulokinase
MGELLLGIDCGSSSTKAALFDHEGRELASSVSGTASVALPNGGAERSSEGVWESVRLAVRSAIAASGASPDSILGIGCSGHGNGLFALDAHGDALPVAYRSLDTRADALIHEWVERGYAERLFRDGWQRAWSGQPLAILGWLKRHDPPTYGSIRTILLCKDFVNHRLTGRVASELTDMSAAGLLSNAEKAYNGALLRATGLDEVADMLPELVHSTQVIGTLTARAAGELGLVAGTPVVGGLFDVAASSLGSGGAAPGYLSLVAGTWSIASVVTDTPLIDGSLLMTSIFADGERWMAIDASATSASNLDWFVREAFIDADPERDGSVFERCCRAAASAELRMSSPLYHPFLYGAPTVPQARAGFYGISGAHTRADLARSVLEGVAFGHRSHVATLTRAGATPERVRLTGGGARSHLWSQMFADVLGMPVEVSDAEESGARGAALAAGIGLGAYRDVNDAMQRGTRAGRSHLPDVALEDVYTQRYGMYCRLMAAMGPIWGSLAAPS